MGGVIHCCVFWLQSRNGRHWRQILAHRKKHRTPFTTLHEINQLVWRLRSMLGVLPTREGSKSWRHSEWTSKNKTTFLIEFLWEAFREDQPQITSSSSHQASSVSKAGGVESNSLLCPQHTHLRNRPNWRLLCGPVTVTRIPSTRFIPSVFYISPLTPNDPYRGRTASLTSKRCILYIYSTNIDTEYFKHVIHSPFIPLQNAVCFIILTYLVPVLFTFYIFIQQI